jgi:cytochrome c biogenesis protein CcmG/thiol:disulfide interchange protein DsbE
MEAVVSRPRRFPLRLLWLIPALAFVGLLVVGLVLKSEAPGIGDPAPTFEGELLDGSGTFSSEELAGRPVLVNFWASWCIPCRDEAPMLSAAEERYGDRVAFVGINIRDGLDDARAFAAERHLDFVHVRDPDQSIYDDFGLTGQPETYFLDDEGRVVEHVPGPLTEDRLFTLLDSLAAR